MDDVTLTPVSQTGATYRVLRVDVKGKTSGYLVGRPERHAGPRWWDYTLGPVEPSGEVFVRMAYPTTSRKNTLDNLLFATKEG